MSKSEKIRAHLRKHPNSSSSAVARRFNCSGSLVTNIKAEMRMRNELNETVKSKSQKIRNHFKKSPSASVSEAAKKFNCTRQLVGHVLREMKAAGKLKDRQIIDTSTSALIREHLTHSPFDSARDISDTYKCSPGLVHNVRLSMALKQQENVPHRVTPTEDGDNARKAHLNKRVKVSRSFLWGAIKYERYE